VAEEPETISLLDENGQEIASTSRPFAGYDRTYLWSPLDEGWKMPIGVIITAVRVRYQSGEFLDLSIYYPRVNDGMSAFEVTPHIEEPESEEVH
jgi:hypothetical protein